MSNVLLVEDDARITLAYILRLKAMGHSVATAYDVDSAVQQVADKPPDLVLMDISLAKGDGFMAAEGIKEALGSASPPIIFITASSKPGLQERANELGAAGFLHKPFDARQMLSAITLALGGRLAGNKPPPSSHDTGHGGVSG